MVGDHRTERDIDIDIAALFASLARNWVRILVIALCVTALAFMIASMLDRHYRAETRILIETRKSVFTRPGGEGNDAAILDEQGVASQVEVITSTDLLKKVAADLKLADRPEFEADGAVSVVERLMIIAGLRADPIDLPPEERVLEVFREKLNVYRVENSRVIVVDFSSEDPRLAADVPNAIAEAYIALQRNAKLQSNSDATEWLEPEIADLTAKVKEAEGRVAAFRSQSDLLIGNNNEVLATQQLSELSSELSRVRANRAAAEANAQSMRTALDAGASVDSQPQVIASTLIQRLRENQVQLQAEVADLSATLLDNHPRLRSLRAQLADLDRQIVEEARRIVRGLENEAEAARLRERELTRSLNTLKAESARAGEEGVELRALEREAAAQRELLESYLSRYREAMSRKDRNYLPVDARIFSRATVPSEPYFPKVIPIAISAFAGALLVMVLVTLLRELFSGRAMRAPDERFYEPVAEVRMPSDEAGVAEAADPAPVAAPADPAEDEAARQDDAAGGAEPVAPAPVFARGQIGIADAAEKLIAGGAARAIFVSPEGDEAAATAVMVAREVADAGLRTILLDLTTTGAASGPMLDGAPVPGITNLLCSQAQFTDIIHEDLYSDCHVIPLGTADAARAMKAVDRLPIIMESLTTAYDLVIVECGPADSAGIRRLAADATDVFVSVIAEDDEAVAETAEELKAGGYGKTVLVTPVGYRPPFSPLPDRRTAA